MKDGLLKGAVQIQRQVERRCTDEDRHGGPGLIAVSGMKWTILVRGRVNAGNIESWDNTEP